MRSEYRSRKCGQAPAHGADRKKDWNQHVKRFFDTQVGDGGTVATAPNTPRASDTVRLSANPAGARIAIYDGLAAAPRVEDIIADELAVAIEQLASRTYNI